VSGWGGREGVKNGWGKWGFVFLARGGWVGGGVEVLVLITDCWEGGDVCLEWVDLGFVNIRNTVLGLINETLFNAN